MPRRAMEHPREWTDFAFATTGLACFLWSSGIRGGVAAAVFVYETVRRTELRMREQRQPALLKWGSGW